jgi:hypothetical protein
MEQQLLAEADGLVEVALLLQNQGQWEEAEKVLGRAEALCALAGEED